MWVHAVVPAVFEAVLYMTAPSAELDDIIRSGKPEQQPESRRRAGSRGQLASSSDGKKED